MYFSKFKKLLAGILLGTIMVSSIPAMAAENGDVKVIFEEVTESDTTTLAGEAKVKVSVDGLDGDVSIAQLDLDFSGELAYKSITYLQGKNEPENGYTLVSPNTVVANINKRLTPSIVSAKTPISMKGTTDLFVLTFSGEPGETVELVLEDLKDSYFTVDGKDIYPAETNKITASASSQANESKKAVVQLALDKVSDFAASANGEYLSSGIAVKITNENKSGYELYTELNNIPISKGGHRDATVTLPTFRFEDTVLSGDRYTVEVTGIGYVSYRQTGVTFDKAVEINTSQFVPGDVNGDGIVDAADKALCQEAIDNGETGLNTDFNRDGKTDKFDMAVFEGIADSTEAVPAKMDKPSVSGTSKKVIISWKKPTPETNVTGYVIQYGTSKNDLNQTQEVKNPDATSADISDLSANTTYYIRIAAKNEKGTGEFSDIVSAKTDSESGGTGGGGAGGGTGGGSYPGGNTINPIQPQNPDEPFTDLGNHAWAKDAIYTLKDKGIISGVSATEFAPANNIKRGDFILILTRMLGVDNAFTENFADVPADSYYYDAIGSAKAAGIASGDGVNYMPENPITRQDLITLAYRAFLGKGYIEEAEDFTSLDAFSDKGNISDYAMAPMASMVKAGIIQGSDGSVNPLGNATRAEVAVMCARLLDLME